MKYNQKHLWLCAITLLGGQHLNASDISDSPEPRERKEQSQTATPQSYTAHGLSFSVLDRPNDQELDDIEAHIERIADHIKRAQLATTPSELPQISAQSVDILIERLGVYNCPKLFELGGLAHLNVAENHQRHNEALNSYELSANYFGLLLDAQPQQPAPIFQKAAKASWRLANLQREYNRPEAFNTLTQTADYYNRFFDLNAHPAPRDLNRAASTHRLLAEFNHQHGNTQQAYNNNQAAAQYYEQLGNIYFDLARTDTPHYMTYFQEAAHFFNQTSALHENPDPYMFFKAGDSNYMLGKDFSNTGPQPSQNAFSYYKNAENYLALLLASPEQATAEHFLLAGKVSLYIAEYLAHLRTPNVSPAQIQEAYENAAFYYDESLRLEPQQDSSTLKEAADAHQCLALNITDPHQQFQHHQKTIVYSEQALPNMTKPSLDFLGGLASAYRYIEKNHSDTLSLNSKVHALSRANDLYEYSNLKTKSRLQDLRKALKKPSLSENEEETLLKEIYHEELALAYYNKKIDFLGNKLRPYAIGFQHASIGNPHLTREGYFATRERKERERKQDTSSNNSQSNSTAKPQEDSEGNA